MKKPKITLVGLDLIPSTGGPSKTIGYFKEALSANVVSFTNPVKLEQEGSAIDETIHIKQKNSFLGRSFAWPQKASDVDAYHVAEQSDLLTCHILWRYSAHWVSRLSHKHSIPYWVILHGCLDPYVFSYRSLVKKVWFFLFGRSFLRNASLIVCATQREREKISELYNGSNVEVVYWPMTSFNFVDEVVTREIIRRNYGIKDDEKVLLFLGRFHSVKRPLETIKAFLNASVDNTILFMVGPFESYSAEYIKEFIRIEGGSEANIRVLGPLYDEEKSNIVLASDGYISLSLKENFGHTIVESLSVGNPVILSPGIDLSMELSTVDCGWFLTDNSVDQASQAIRAFSQMSNEELDKIGERGKCWVVENLSFQHFQDKLTKLVEKTVQRN